MGGKLAGWLGGWQDENKATLSAHPSSLWDRIGFSSGPSVAKTAWCRHILDGSIFFDSII